MDKYKDEGGGGGGGFKKNLTRGGSGPEVQPFTLSCTILAD